MSHLDVRHFNQNVKKVPICTGNPKLKKKSVHTFSCLSLFLWLETDYLVLKIASLSSCTLLLLRSFIVILWIFTSNTREGAVFHSQEKGGFENSREVVRSFGTDLLWNLTYNSIFHYLLSINRMLHRNLIFLHPKKSTLKADIRKRHLCSLLSYITTQHRYAVITEVWHEKHNPTRTQPGYRRQKEA